MPKLVNETNLPQMGYSGLSTGSNRVRFRFLFVDFVIESRPLLVQVIIALAINDGIASFSLSLLRAIADNDFSFGRFSNGLLFITSSIYFLFSVLFFILRVTGLAGRYRYPSKVAIPQCGLNIDIRIIQLMMLVSFFMSYYAAGGLAGFMGHSLAAR